MFIAVALFSVTLLIGLYFISQGLAAKSDNNTIYMSPTPEPNDISSSASISRKVAPDLLQIQLRVETDARDAKESQTTNAAVMSDLRTRVKAVGVQDPEIETSYYTVEPVYTSNRKCIEPEGCTWESVLTGYRTVHTITISTIKLDKAGDIIDAGIKAGVNQTFVDSVSFSLRPGTRTALETNLLMDASVEAKAKAQKMADGLGVRLGKLKTASQGYTYTPYAANYRDAMAVSAPPAPSTVISPGQIDITASVNVDYAVGS